MILNPSTVKYLVYTYMYQHTENKSISIYTVAVFLYQNTFLQMTYLTSIGYKNNFILPPKRMHNLE